MTIKSPIDLSWERTEPLIQAGRTAVAETILSQALAEAEQKEGFGSLSYLKGIEYLVACQMSGRQFFRAIETLQAALALPEPTDAVTRKQWLALYLILGDVLRLAGEPAQAEEILRQGLQKREQFYGKSHAGYAFGLEPLADALFVQGKLDEALPLYQETIQLFSDLKHPRLVTARVHDAFARKAAAPEKNPFATLTLRTDGWEQLAAVALEFSQTLAEGEGTPALWSLQTTLEKQLGEAHPRREATLIHLSEKERASSREGSNTRRQKALMLLANLYHKRGQKEQLIQAMLGIALAQGDAGQLDEAQATYTQAIGQARKLENPNLLARALRNQGLLFYQSQQSEAAERCLREAVEVSDLPIARTDQAQAQIALGILLQHSGKLTEARPLLEAALKTLPTNDPHTVPVRTHLLALKQGKLCGCGEGGLSFLDGFQAYLETQLPPEWRGMVHLAQNEEGNLVVETETKLPNTEETRLFHLVNHCYATYHRLLNAF